MIGRTAEDAEDAFFFPASASVGVRLRAREAVLLEAPVEARAREAEVARRAQEVAAVALERALDQHALGLVERHPVDRRRGRALDHQTEVLRAHALAAREQHAALDGVVELAHVAGPGVRVQRGLGRGLETVELLAV